MNRRPSQPADELRHDLPILVAIGFLRDGITLGLLVPARRVVVAAHVEIHIEVIFGPAMNIRIVSGNAGRQSRISNALYDVGQFSEFATGQHLIRLSAVHKDRIGVAPERASHGTLDTGQFGGGLCDPLNAAALVAILTQHADDMIVCPSQKSRHPLRLSICESRLDTCRGIPLAHLQIASRALV